jgi:hypothetical protein
MATWKAEIKTTPTGSIYPVTVEANASYVAKQEIEHRYNPIFIRNLRQISNSSSSDSQDSADSASIGGLIVMIGLVAVGWVFVSFTPWILMGLGGAGATWIGQKVTGQTIEEYKERDDGKGNKRFAFLLIMTLLAGGFGFVKGTELQQEFNTPTTPVEVDKTK